MASTAPTVEDFQTAYPQFQQTEDEIQFQLNLSSRLVNPAVFEDLYSDAVLLDAAHNLQLSALSQSSNGLGALQMAAGPISSVSAAGTSTSFATPSMDSKSARTMWYSKTSYGQQLLRIWNVVAPVGFLA